MSKKFTKSQLKKMNESFSATKIRGGQNDLCYGPEPKPDEKATLVGTKRRIRVRTKK